MKLPKCELRDIIIHTHRSNVRPLVAARVYGPFAIHHRTICPAEKCTDEADALQWAITHAPTGRRIGSACTPAKARAYCRALLDLDVHWASKTPPTPQDYESVVALRKKMKIES